MVAYSIRKFPALRKQPGQLFSVFFSILLFIYDTSKACFLTHNVSRSCLPFFVAKEIRFYLMFFTSHVLSLVVEKAKVLLLQFVPPPGFSKTSVLLLEIFIHVIDTYLIVLSSVSV